MSGLPDFGTPTVLFASNFLGSSFVMSFVVPIIAVALGAALVGMVLQVVGYSPFARRARGYASSSAVSGSGGFDLITPSRISSVGKDGRVLMVENGGLVRVKKGDLGEGIEPEDMGSETPDSLIVRQGFRDGRGSVDGFGGTYVVRKGSGWSDWRDAGNGWKSSQHKTWWGVNEEIRVRNAESSSIATRSKK